MVVVAIFANLLGDPSVLMYFALYFIAVAFVMFVMFERVMILRCILALMKKTAPSKYAKGTAVNYFRTRDTPRWSTRARGRTHDRPRHREHPQCADHLLLQAAGPDDHQQGHHVRASQ